MISGTQIARVSPRITGSSRLLSHPKLHTVDSGDSSHFQRRPLSVKSPMNLFETLFLGWRQSSGQDLYKFGRYTDGRKRDSVLYFENSLEILHRLALAAMKVHSSSPVKLGSSA